MFKHYLSRALFNLPGWRSKRRIVVIESDDWGSIRMPTRETYEACLKAGYPVDKIAYERYDTLASEDDLELLFDLLSSLKDARGNPPVITSNCLVANPDFERIQADGYNSYQYELISETFRKYPRHGNNLELWKQGRDAKVFHPQYHGREHLNVSLFMEALQKNDRDAHFGFMHQMPGSIPLGPAVNGNPYVEALRYRSEQDKNEKLKIFLEGLDLFEDLFGYRSASIIPPNYTWSPDFSEPAHGAGVRYIQGIRVFKEPAPDGSHIQHGVYLGKKNPAGQTFLLRNAVFEPSLFGLGIKDPVGQCLTEMAIAFRLHKPVLVTSHRINYVGFLDEGNRDRGLTMLREVLEKALKKWPDLEFMSSDQLGALINSGESKR